MHRNIDTAANRDDRDGHRESAYEPNFVAACDQRSQLSGSHLPRAREGPAGRSPLP